MKGTTTALRRNYLRHESHEEMHELHFSHSYAVRARAPPSDVSRVPFMTTACNSEPHYKHARIDHVQSMQQDVRSRTTDNVRMHDDNRQRTQR